MHIKRTVKTKHEIALPKPIYATIPSADEIDAAKGLIGLAEYDEAPRTYSGYYYLRTPGEGENTIMYAAGDSVEDETDPDFDDPGPDDFFDYGCRYGTGNRPLIVFGESLFDAGCKLGDQIVIWRWSFTIIGEKIALCDQLISVDIFDEKTNVYENSAIKKRVDAWFAEKILPEFD